MEETTGTDTAIAESVTPETTTDVTPSEPQAEQETTAEVTEAQEVKAPEQKKAFVEGLTYETPEDLVKGVKEKDATISKISQELAELKKAQETNQYEQQKTQVETGNVQLKQEYGTILNNLTSQKSQLRAEALANYNDTGDVTAYDYALQYIDSQFDQAKTQLDGNYQNVETQLTQQQRELRTQAVQRAVTEFKEKESDFVSKYPKVVDAYLAKGYDPADLPMVKELLDLALSEVDNRTSLLNANNEAKQKLVSSTTSGADGNSENHIFTYAEIDKMSTKQFKKYEKTIDKQLTKGLIK